MPPKAALPLLVAPVARRANLRTGGDPTKDGNISGPVTPFVGGPAIEVRRACILTFTANAIVIATDVDITHRNEHPHVKFLELAGKTNLTSWNKNVHYQWHLDLATNKYYRAPRLAPTLVVKSPSFQTATNDWIVFVNVPDFVPGPAAGGGRFRGNGDQLYRCYTNAFNEARSNANTNIPAALLASLNNPMPPLPAHIAFSFMGPSNGWDIQDAALIAMFAISDSFIASPRSTVIAADRAANVAQFTRVTILASHYDKQKPLEQRTALRAAFSHVFGGAGLPVIPPLLPAPVLPPPPPPPLPGPGKYTRSGRRYG